MRLHFKEQNSLDESNIISTFGSIWDFKLIMLKSTFLGRSPEGRHSLFLDFFTLKSKIESSLHFIQLSGATQLKWQLENDLQVVSTSIKWNRKLWTVSISSSRKKHHTDDASSLMMMMWPVTSSVMRVFRIFHSTQEAFFKNKTLKTSEQQLRKSLQTFWPKLKKLRLRYQ